MLSGVSRFPLGLLDLFGVKQMGAYPGEIAQAYQPTLDMLRMAVAANAQSTIVDLPINQIGAVVTPTGSFDILYDGVNPLQTEQNEAMFISAWHIQHVATGAGADCPDAQLVLDAISGGQRISVSEQNTGAFSMAGAAGQTFTYAKGNADTMIYIPPGFIARLLTTGDTTTVVGAEVRISVCIRYLKMRV